MKNLANLSPSSRHQTSFSQNTPSYRPGARHNLSSISHEQDARINYIHTQNLSNISIVCRIRKPTQLQLYGPTDKSTTSKRSNNISISPSIRRKNNFQRNKSYSNLNRSLSTISHNTSYCSKSPSSHSVSGSPNRSLIKRMINPNSSLLQNYKYSVFTTISPQQNNDLVVATESPITGKVIQNTFTNSADLNYLWQNKNFNQSSINYIICYFSERRVNQAFVFKFDRVFSDQTKQDRFYTQCIQDMTSELMDGQSSCIVLFGPTQSGKTYSLKGSTLSGGPERGILQRSVQQLFDYINASNTSAIASYKQSNNNNSNILCNNNSDLVQDQKLHQRLSLRVSIFQIHCDKISDLLSSSSASANNNNNNNNNIYNNNISIQNKRRQQHQETQHIRPIQRKVKSIDQYLQLLKDSMRTRKILSSSSSSSSSSTRQVASRSHCIYTLNLYRRDLVTRRYQRISRLDFVQLCGSEYAASFTSTNLTGKKIEELRSFASQSFNSLSSAIIRCGEPNPRPSEKTYQLSKEQSMIRHMLGDTLAANNKILFVVNAAPSPSKFMHSLPALKFASQIRDAICRNQETRRLSTNNTPSRLNYKSAGATTRQSRREDYYDSQNYQDYQEEDDHAMQQSPSNSRLSPLGTTGRGLKSVEEETSFSTRKNSHRSIGSPLRISKDHRGKVPFSLTNPRQMTKYLRENILNYSTYGKSREEFDNWRLEKERQIYALMNQLDNQIRQLQQNTPRSNNSDILELKNCKDQVGLLSRQIHIMEQTFRQSVQQSKTAPSSRSKYASNYNNIIKSSTTTPSFGPAELSSSQQIQDLSPRLSSQNNSKRKKKSHNFKLPLQDVKTQGIFGGQQSALAGYGGQQFEDYSQHGFQQDEQSQQVPEWMKTKSYSSFQRLKQRFKKTTQKSNQFKLTLKQFVQKCNSLQSEVDSKQQIIAQYQSLFDQHNQCYNKTIAELEGKMQGLNNALHFSKQKLNEQEAATNQHINKLKEQIERQQILNKELNLNCIQIGKQSEDMKIKYEHEKQKNVNLVQEYEKTRKLHMTTAERSEMKMQREHLETKNNYRELKQQLKDKIKICDGLKEENCSLRFDVKQSGMKLEISQGTLAKLENQLADLKKISQTQSLRLAQSDKALELNKIQNQQLRQDLAASDQMVQQLRQRINQSGNEFKLLGAKQQANKDLLSQLERENGNLRETKRDLQKRIREQEMDKVTYEQRLNESIKNNQNLERANRDTSMQNEYLKRQIEPLKRRENESVNLMKRCAELQTQLNIFGRDKETLQDIIQNLELDRNNLDLQNKDLQTTNVRLEGEVSFLSRRQDQVCDNLITQTKNFQQLETIDKRVESVQGRFTRVSEENIKLKEAERSLKKDLLKSQQDNQNLNSRIADLEHNLISLKSKSLQPQHLQYDDIRVFGNENFDKTNFSGAIATPDRFHGTHGTVVSTIGRPGSGDDFVEYGGSSQSLKKQNKAKIFEDMQGMISRYRQEKITRKHQLPPTFLNAEHYSTYSNE